MTLYVFEDCDHFVNIAAQIAGRDISISLLFSIRKKALRKFYLDTKQNVFMN